MTAPPRRYRFTAEQFVLIEHHQVLGPAGSTELLDGVIYDVQPRRSELVDRAARTVAAAWGDVAPVLTRSPLLLSWHSVPIPDVQVRSGGENPHLIIEIAETSLAVDRDIKLPIYADQGIPEVWIVDLKAEAVHVHTEPDGRGYRTVRALGIGDELVPVAVDGVRIAVADIL